MSKKAVVIGLLAGAVAGALAGILLAPDKGSKTRKKISGSTKKTVDGIKENLNNFVDTVVNKFSKTSEEISDKYDRVKSAAANSKQ